MRQPFHEDWHREHVMTFKRGFHVFWEKEFMPAVLELIQVIGHVLEVGKYLLFAFWVVLPYSLLITGLEKPEATGDASATLVHLFWRGWTHLSGDCCGGSFYSSCVPPGECAYRRKPIYARVAKWRSDMTVAISARMQALMQVLVKKGFRGNFAVIDDTVSRKANPILLETVQKDKCAGDVDGIHPMRDRLQNRGKGTLYIDPLLDYGCSANQVMAGLGFSGKPIVFDKPKNQGENYVA